MKSTFLADNFSKGFYNLSRSLPVNTSKTADNRSISKDSFEFYIHFISEKALLNLNIIGHKNVKNEGYLPYTIYVIEVQTIDFSFKIAKRYSEFYELFSKLKYLHGNSLSLTMFPGKRLIGNMNEQFIEERKINLENFLKYLLKKYNEYILLDFLQFLDIRKHYSLKQIKLGWAFFDQILAMSENLIEKSLLEALIKLNKHLDNMIPIFREIETIIGNKDKRISAKIIRILLLGYKKVRGLMSFCGRTSQNSSENMVIHHVCTIGLKMLSKLFDFEFNNDAQEFIDEFSKSETSDVKLLHLARHIVGKTQKTCKLSALRLLDLFIENNVDSIPAQDICRDLGGDELLLEYEKWKMGVNQQVRHDIVDDDGKQRCLSSVDWSNYRLDSRRDSLRKSTQFRRGDSVSCTPEKCENKFY